jgi:hypothetical protein
MKATKKPKGFTDEERAAMRERIQELKADAPRGRGADLDEGHMWPTPFALKELTAAEEARICTLVKKAMS